MEWINIVKDLICNVGFPIFCVCVMFRENEKTREAHERESQVWADAFNKNTEVLRENTQVMEKALQHIG